MRLSLLNPDGTPAMFGDHVNEEVIGPKRVHLMAEGDVMEPLLRLSVDSPDSPRWELGCVVAHGIGHEIGRRRLRAFGGEFIPLPGIPDGKGLALDVTICLPENPIGGTVSFGLDAVYVETELATRDSRS